MRMNSITGLSRPAFPIPLAGPPPASAGTVTLPLDTATFGTWPGTNCLVFDNFTVFSLALLNYQAGAGDVNGNDPYPVSTNGNALRDALVIGTSPGGALGNTDPSPPPGQGDNPYNTPTPGTGNPTNFSTNRTG